MKICAKNDFHISAFRDLTFNLVTSNIALPVTPHVCNLCYKFERCMVFRLRVNSGHVTETDGQTYGVYRVMRPSRVGRIIKVWDKQCCKARLIADAGEREDVQKKTFTKWINARLSAYSQPIITDLFDDFRDGTHLLALLEILTGIPLVSTCASPHTFCLSRLPGHWSRDLGVFMCVL